MFKRRGRALAGLVVAVGMIGAGCGGSAPARMPDKVKEAAAAPRAASLPAWFNGEFPQEPSLFGYAEAPIAGGDKVAAMKKAEEISMAYLGKELALLVKLIKDDHEEQVAEIATRYSVSEFDAHLDAAAEAALEKVVLVEEFVDEGHTPPRLLVFHKLPIDAVFEAIDARQELPEAQRSRIRNYAPDFTDAVLAGLARGVE